jgi:hypothetical protein
MPSPFASTCTTAPGGIASNHRRARAADVRPPCVVMAMGARGAQATRAWEKQCCDVQYLSPRLGMPRRCSLSACAHQEPSPQRRSCMRPLRLRPSFFSLSWVRASHPAIGQMRRSVAFFSATGRGAPPPPSPPPWAALTTLPTEGLFVPQPPCSRFRWRPATSALSSSPLLSSSVAFRLSYTGAAPHSFGAHRWDSGTAAGWVPALCATGSPLPSERTVSRQPSVAR